MSSCVIIHNKNNLIFASDTALSTYVDGVFYRVDSNYHKVLPYNNGWYFCCGTVSTVERIRERINEYGFEDIEIWLRVNSKPSFNGIYDIELIQIDKYTHIVYQYSQYNNFNCIVHVPPVCGFNVITSGYKTSELYALISEGMTKTLDIPKIITDSYQRICDECVGGSLDLNINGEQNNILLYENVINNKNLGCELLVITEFVESGHISGSTIVGSQIGIGTYNDGHYCFEVDKNGNMIAKQGYFIDGTLESSNIISPTITNGNSFYVDNNGMICGTAMIGGWRFENGTISSNGLTINSDGSIDGKTWYITASGEANFRDCNLYLPYNNTKVNGIDLQSYLDSLITNNIYVKNYMEADSAYTERLSGYSIDFNTLTSSKVETTVAEARAVEVLNETIAEFINVSKVNATYITAGTIDVKNLKINETDYKSYLSPAEICKASWDNNSKISADVIYVSTAINCGRYQFAEFGWTTIPPIVTKYGGVEREVLSASAIGN